MTDNPCPECLLIAEADCRGQPWRVDFRYRQMVGRHHPQPTADTGVRGPHVTDPYRL